MVGIYDKTNFDQMDEDMHNRLCQNAYNSARQKVFF